MVRERTERTRMTAISVARVFSMGRIFHRGRKQTSIYLPVFESRRESVIWQLTTLRAESREEQMQVILVAGTKTFISTLSRGERGST